MGGLLSIVGAIAMIFVAHSLTLVMVCLLVEFIGNGMLMSGLPVAVARVTRSADISSANGVNALARTVGIAASSCVYALIIGLIPGGSAGSTWALLLWANVAAVIVAVALILPGARALPHGARRGTPGDLVAVPPYE